jgi:hypothetical protein
MCKHDDDDDDVFTVGFLSGGLMEKQLTGTKNAEE